MYKILIVTLEPLARQMAGPAIRALELGRQLSREFDVTVVSPRPTDINIDQTKNTSFHQITACSKRALYGIARNCDIFILQANVLKPYPLLSRMGKYIVLDLYDPYLFSLLAQYKDDQLSSSTSYRLMHQVLEKHMTVCDFSICASERQRDYWLGRYCAIGRLTPDIYQIDQTLRKLIDVVPFGLPADQPQRTGPGIKGQIPGIGQSDHLLLWGGGIWEWFDPFTVIQAVAKLSKIMPNLKLFFMGWKSPNPQVPLMNMAIKARKLAGDLGLLGKNVIFHDSWVPYEARINYLLDADIAVSAHFDLPETRFAFRTRILDYLWAGLPIVTTCGDQLSEMINLHQAGFALPYGDVQSWVKAISNILNDNSLKTRLAAGSKNLATEFVWSKIIEPLRQYCHNPHRLPAHKVVTMPSLLERMQSVYSRGGTDLVIQRSKDFIEDLIKR